MGLREEIEKAVAATKTFTAELAVAALAAALRRTVFRFSQSRVSRYVCRPMCPNGYRRW